MANDINSSIKLVYGMKLAKNYDNAGVAMKVVNFDYAPQIKAGGTDTVRINKLGDIDINDYTGTIIKSALSTTSQDLVVNQYKHFAFNIGSIEKKQSMLNLMEKFSKRSKIAIGLVKDTRILSHVAQADSSNNVTETGVTATDIYDIFTEMLQKLQDSGAIDGEGKDENGKLPFVIIPPRIRRLLVSSGSKLIIDVPETNKILRKGSLGNVAGFDTLVSNNVSTVGANQYNVMFGTSEAITFASQIEEFEILKDPNAFGDMARGLYAYASRVVNAKSLGKLDITLA